MDGRNEGESGRDATDGEEEGRNLKSRVDGDNDGIRFVEGDAVVLSAFSALAASVSTGLSRFSDSDLLRNPTESPTIKLNAAKATMPMIKAFRLVHLPKIRWPNMINV